MEKQLLVMRQLSDILFLQADANRFKNPEFQLIGSARLGVATLKRGNGSYKPPLRIALDHHLEIPLHEF